MPLVTIDGQTIEVPEGENVIEAARRIGIEIPHYCYHPGLPIDGNCRMCLVEIDDFRGPQIACNTILNTHKDREGRDVPAAVVHTDTAQVRQMRQGVLEFLLLNHPIDCPVCDQAGECGLQDYYMQHGQYGHRSVIPKIEKAKAVAIGPLVVLDQERCILCSRCVRFTEHVTKTYELVIAGRGDQCRIETFPGRELNNDYSGNVVDICPVGALTSRDFRFKKRVWFLSETATICVGCSRGCNVYLDHADEIAYRYRPRFNPDVNTWWLCDRGRLTYKEINEGRLTAPFLEGSPTSWALAFESTVKAIQDPGVGIVIGPDASLEDMYVAKKLAAGLGTPIWGIDWRPRGKDDEFLMKADQSPNRNGFELIGLSTDENAFFGALSTLKTLFTIGVEVPPEYRPHDAGNNRSVRTIAMLTHEGPQAKSAAIALPLATHAERFGTYAQFEGRVQKVVPAFAPPGDALPAVQILALLGAKCGIDLSFDLEIIWGELGPLLGFEAASFGRLPAAGFKVARSKSAKAGGAV